MPPVVASASDGTGEMTWRACLATSSGPSRFGPLLFTGRVAECAAVSRELGLVGIEIAMRSPAELDARELEALLRAHRLELAAVGSGRMFLEDGLSLCDPDPAGRAKAVARVNELSAYAGAFGAPVIIGLARGKMPADGDLDAALDRFVESMRECAEQPAAGGGLLVEAINRYETPLLTTAAETVAAVERIGASRVEVLLDTFHMNIEEVSVAEAIRTTGPRLGHLHLVDSNRRAAGMGHIDFGEVAAALADVGYGGWLSAEVLPLPTDRAAAEQHAGFAASLSESSRVSEGKGDE